MKTEEQLKILTRGQSLRLRGEPLKIAKLLMQLRDLCPFPLEVLRVGEHAEDVTVYRQRV